MQNGFKNYLVATGKTWEQFKHELFYAPFTLNIVGIMIWARAYHVHVRVFFGYNYWTTHCDHDLNKVHVFLLYRGNNWYDDTCCVGGMEYRERYKEFTRNARRIERHFKKISDAKKQKMEADKAAGKEPASSSDNDQIPAVTSDVEIDMEAMMEKLHDNVQNAASKPSANNVQNIVNMDSGRGLDDNSKNISDTDGENKQPSPIKTDATKHEEQQQEETTEPVQEIGSNESNAKDVSADKKPVNVQKSKSSVAAKLIQKAKSRIKGSWHFAKQKQKIDIKQPMCKVCGLVKANLTKLEEHMRKKHKSFRYKCRYCKKTYQTKNGLYKHKLYHTVGLRYNCKDCTMGFIFFSQYREHRNVHTTSSKHRFPCRKGCDKDYGSTRAQNYHERQHQAKKIVCKFKIKKGEKCRLEFTSKQSYEVHYRGFHGPGWDSLCGKNYKWPAKKTQHENECTVCKGIKKRKAKKRYTEPSK